MLNHDDVNYFNFGKEENNKFWKRLGSKPNFKDKTVLDFGCGHGSLSIDIAISGAKKVVGIDLENNYINFANQNLYENFNKLKDKVEFLNTNILTNENLKNFDYIVSKDTFEHSINLENILKRFNQILNIDGKVFVGFGPLYNFYNGDHGRTNAFLPWFHLIIPEKFLIKKLNEKNNSKITKIEDLGLNKYSFKEYLEFFKNSDFEILFFKKNLSSHPIAFIFNLLSNIKFLEEYFTYNIYCILKKKN